MFSDHPGDVFHHLEPFGTTPLASRGPPASNGFPVSREVRPTTAARILFTSMMALSSTSVDHSEREGDD